MKCLIFQQPYIFPLKKNPPKNTIAPGHLLAFLQHIAAQFLKESHPTSRAKVQNLLSASAAWQGSSPGGPRFHISTPPFRCTKMRSKKMNELSPPKNWEQISKLGTAWRPSKFEPTHFFPEDNLLFFRGWIFHCHFSHESKVLIRHHPLHPQSQKLPKIQCAKNVKNPRNFQARFIFIPKCRTPFNQKNSYMHVILNNLIQISHKKLWGFHFFPTIRWPWFLLQPTTPPTRKPNPQWVET